MKERQTERCAWNKQRRARPDSHLRRLHGKGWYDFFSDRVEAMGFQRCSIDRCVFRKAELTPNGRQICIILAYVDDFLVIGDAPIQRATCTALRGMFPVTEGGADYLAAAPSQTSTPRGSRSEATSGSQRPTFSTSPKHFKKKMLNKK